MGAKVVWKQGMSFTGSADTGFSLPMGAAPVVGGDNDGFRPMELFLIGLGGCTAMDVISILGKMQQDVATFEVHVSAERAAEHPKVFTHGVIEYLISGNDLDIKAVERAVLLSEKRYCPGQAMLGEVMKLETKITINEGTD
jgi:putative redox protein